jgi:hypothetical protein
MAVHREEFLIATAPVAPEPPALDQDAIRKRHELEAMRGIGALHRKARATARQQAASAAAAEIASAVTARAQQYMVLQGWQDEQWRKLLANDPDVVFATVTEAFEDNEVPAAVISVDSGAASVVIMCPDLSAVPDRMPERTAAGNLAFKETYQNHPECLLHRAGLRNRSCDSPRGPGRRSCSRRRPYGRGPAVRP